jgi:hypothetical protein
LNALLVQRLVDTARVIPVLDGLDEMSEPARISALRAINDTVGRDGPFIITCRTQEYQDVIVATGMPLARAAVVELEPVKAVDASGYLQAGQIEGAKRWAAVVAHLREQPNGALALALSTPLMVYLARAVYTSPDTNPETLTRFTEPVSIETHLQQAYLPAIYAAPQSKQEQHRSSHPYRPDRATAWLALLARHLHQQQSRDFAWWRLFLTIRHYRILFGSVIGIAVTLFALPIALLNIPEDMVSLRLAAVGSVILSAVFCGVWIRFKGPQRAVHPLQARWIVIVAVIGGVAIYATYVLGGAAFAAGLAAVFSWLLPPVLSAVSEPATAVDLIDPRTALRSDRNAFLAGVESLP